MVALTQPQPHPGPQRLSPVSLADPFEVLFACEGNEALAAEQMGISVAEFFRKLKAADPDSIHRGMAARMAITLARLLTTVEGAIIDRINDADNPLSDSNLVALLTRGIPALTELTRAGTPLAPGNSNPHIPTEVPPAVQAILDKINAEAAEGRSSRVIAGDT